MDSYELNKIAGAVLGTLVFVMGFGFLGEVLFEPRHHAKPGYELPGLPEAEAATAPAGGEPAAAAEPIAVRLASADPGRGEAAAKKCGACHQWNQDGKNNVGPLLWGVVERPKGSEPGFIYSDAMKAHAGEKWTFENIDAFITNPKGYLPGTKMAFAGVSSPKERADIIDFLRTKSGQPVPLPPKP